MRQKEHSEHKRAGDHYSGLHLGEKRRKEVDNVPATESN